MKRLVVVLGFFMFIGSSRAQESDNLKHCGADEAQNKVFLEHPEIYEAYKLMEAQDLKKDQEDFKSGYRNARMSSGPVYKIPIVFHIVHNYGTENITDAQVIDAVRILNEDYRKLNADTSSVVAEFKSIVADAEVEFVLANTDPNGNCTRGIERIVSNKTYYGDDNTKFDPWPYTQYLNVWTCSSIGSGAAGYAYKPGTAPSTSLGSADGVLILADYVGSIGTGAYGTARALSHEIGHWLGLSHTWGNTNSPGVACGDDGISDTPVTKGWTVCNLSNNDVCNNGVVENLQNYMEYAYCQRMFTTGQVALMRTRLTQAPRMSLWSTSNLTSTGADITPPNNCAPQSDFKNTYKMVCAGSSVTFTDVSSGVPTSWNWSFPGGTPSTSTSSSPSIAYNTPGVYNVSLTASNSYGTGTTTTKTGYIIVNSTSAPVSAPFTEGFQTASSITAYSPNPWIVKSEDSYAWSQYPGAGSASSSSIRLQNYNATGGDIDEVISSSIDMTTVTSPTFSFDVAYTQKTTADNDRLRVYFSTDCGKTWSQRYSKSGATLNTTTGVKTTNFLPAASEWRKENIGITTYASATNLKVKFEFLSDKGNNIYIDNIMIGGVLPVNNYDPLAMLNLSVFPNPLEENSMISFNLNQKQKVNVNLIDVLGRTVVAVANDEFSSGEHQLKLNHASLKPGVYFVSVKVGEKQTAFQKVLIQ